MFLLSCFCKMTLFCKLDFTKLKKKSFFLIAIRIISQKCIIFAQNFEGVRIMYMFNFKKFTIMITNINLSFTKTGKKSLRYADGVCKGRKLDKCSMSNFFPACSYYSIYWPTANYDDMVEAFLSLPNIAVL